jgi:site-specific recombinase XerD
MGRASVGISKITKKDLEGFEGYLKLQGFKNNTRRRKILTVRRLFRFLSQRNQISMDHGRRVSAPVKIERIPKTTDALELKQQIIAQPKETRLQNRNRVLLWVLAETGCLVSEVGRLTFDQVDAPRSNSFQIEFLGKNARVVPISRELFTAIHELDGNASQWVFTGFNKYGPLTGAMTSRGVELLVKSFADRLGVPDLTPRMIRHSAVIQMYIGGLTRLEIQARLGLKTQYAFRIHEPVFASIDLRKKKAAAV